MWKCGAARFTLQTTKLFDDGEKKTKLTMGFTCGTKLLNPNLPSLSQLIHVVCIVALRCKAQQQIAKRKHRCDATALDKCRQLTPL